MKTQALTKGERTHQAIIEAAFRCIARDGYHATTFQTIADEVGLSQPLIVRHFGSRDEIFPIVLGYFLDRARSQTEEVLKKRATPAQQRAGELLKSYIEVSFEIFLSSPEMQTFYLAVYGHSPFEPRIRAINAGVKAQAVSRVQAIVELGIMAGEFKPEVSPNQAARTVHNMLTGTLLNWIIEALPEREELRVTLIQALMAFMTAGVRK